MTLLQRLEQEIAAEGEQLTENDIADNPKHPIYTHRQKVRDYNGPVNPLNANYSTSGKMLRGRLRHFSKEDHLRTGDKHARHAKEHESQHHTIANKSLKDLREKGVDPGPLISGVVSGKFDEDTKNKLRHHAHTASAHSGAAFAHYAAAGKRIDTARTRYHSVRAKHK
jgi:hypothetical protein